MKDVESRTAVTRSGVGRSVPSTFTTGYRYARMGYTTVFEPASPPLKTRTTHKQLDDTPILDKGCFPLFGNDWFLMDYLKAGKIEEAAAYVAWMIRATKGYAIKIVNPGGVESWGWGKNVDSLDDQVPRFGLTPREIITSLCKINNLLKLPHPVHCHTTNLGTPGNYVFTLETMDCVANMPNEQRPTIHVTHVQFNGFTGDSWINIGSSAPEIADYVNRREHVSIDTGQIVFGDTTTMTADGPFQYALAKATGSKWMNVDVETETGSGIVPYEYKKSNYVNAIQWGIGLELSLMVKDPWKVFMSTDHPNGGPFTEYPRVMTWLMSKKAREKVVRKLNRNARRRLSLPGLDREYSFDEITIVTRAGTASSLGLTTKGHLGEGADADIAIYPINPTTVDPSREFRIVRKALSMAAYTVKAGEIVVRDGETVASRAGRTFWIDPVVRSDLEKKVEEELRNKFDTYYTIKMDNYPVREDHMANPSKITVKAGL